MLALQIPTPYGPAGQEFYKGVDWLVANGWRAATVEIGMPFIHDATDYRLLKYALVDGFLEGIEKFILRLGVNVQPYVYKGGARVKNPGGSDKLSYWGELAGGGWSQPHRPPESVWDEIVVAYRAIVEAAIAACKQCGKDPLKALAVVFFNEPGIDGNGGPHVGSFASRSMPPELVGRPKGFIEPGFWKMARFLVSRTALYGVPGYLLAFEASGGADGQVELDSCVGPDFEAAFRARPGYCINSYAPRCVVSSEVGGLWSSATLSKLERAGLHPVLGSAKRRAVCEANVMADRVPSGSDVSAFRRVCVGAMRELAGLDFVSVFTLRGVEACELVDRDWSAVGGVVRGA
jgi:hypothetical protein